MKAPSALFDRAAAAAYEERFARLAPLRDALHLLIRILLSDLPPQARILCVGAGTGAELIALAQAFPEATFTAVEPSGPMLDVCRDRTREAGLAERCTYHEGFLESLPPGAPYHAATSLLVSQFILDRAARVDFFRHIAARLVPGGSLITSDLCGDLDSDTSAGLREAWPRMLEYTGVPAEQAGKYLEGWRRDVAVRPPAEVAAIITEAGFPRSTLISQSLFIHAWHARCTG